MLVVEDGTGLALADSYVSLDEAEAYFALYPNETWTGTDAEKEGALRIASRDIDLVFGSELAGTRLKATQALLFPRLGETAISNSLKRATLELAALVLNGYSATAAPTEDSSVTEYSYEVPGAYKESTKWGNGRGATASLSPTLHRVRLMLLPLLALTPSAATFTFMPVVRG